MVADAASSCSIRVGVSMVAVARRMEIQNFPIPCAIRLRSGGVLADGCAWHSAVAEAKAFVSLLKARLPCEAGLEVPLFSELASASIILCNVAITVFRSICSYVSVPMAHFRQRPGRRKHSTGKKAREKIPLICPRDGKVEFGFPETPK